MTNPAAMYGQVLDAQILAENVRLGNVTTGTMANGAMNTATSVGNAIIAPVTQPWANGQYVEAVTRGVIEVATLPLTILKSGKLAKGADALTDAATANKATNAADAAADANKAKDAGDAAKAPEPQGPNGNGGKVKYRRAKKRINCFCVQDNAKGGRDEYDRQLKKQQEGINSMSASDYLAERKAYTGKDPCDGYKPTESGATKFRDPSVTKKAKKNRQEHLSEKYSEDFRQKGLSRKDAKKMGQTKAQHEISMQDALHNQDMVAGGHDVIGSLKADH